MSIVTKCMVANIQIGMWQGYRLDKEASRDVTTQAKASDDAARVNKHLISKEALKPIGAAAGNIRSHFYNATLPWKDNGDRVLTRACYMDFIVKHGELKDKFLQAVETFIAEVYPVELERAEFRMGALFKPEDYPTASQLRRKFFVNLDIDPVTDAHDFRVQLDDGREDEIRAQIEEATQRRLSKAMGDVWARLKDVLEHYARKVSDTESVFRNTTVTNLQEIVELLPALNITDDPDLEAIRQDLLQTIVEYDAEDIRQRTDVRAYSAQEANRILGSMNAFMNAFKESDE